MLPPAKKPMDSCAGAVGSRADAPDARRSLAAKTLPPDQDVFEHHEVTEQAVKRILKGRGAVLLEEEMPDPGKGVAEQRHSEQPSPGLSQQCGNESRQGQHGAHEMQHPAGGIAMLSQVEWVEFPETPELLRRFTHRSLLLPTPGYRPGRKI